jgi:starch phosphorylase
VYPSISFFVKPDLPENLKLLEELADNIWFCWNYEAIELFQRIDEDLWISTQHNPRAMLNQIKQERLNELARDAGFQAQLERVIANYYTYKQANNFQYLGNRAPADFSIAYFSAEYGLADCLPIYSGGLGMLSGDHMKSASDLNLPLVGIGLAYRQGYFTQFLNSDGWQQETYNPNDFYNMPMGLLKDGQGNAITITVPIENRALIARVWQVNIGRIALYLLDANIDVNPPDLRSITHQLYGGDTEMRIRQEILLGIGGVRLLDALGLKPNVFHMNEGHSAFAALERIRVLRQRHGLSFDEAKAIVKASNCFTTHTPVPAGNDYFSPELVRRHFQEYVEELGISLPVLLAFGRVDPLDQQGLFCMTVLALRFSTYNNGVSRLHGDVSRQMWKEIWPRFPIEDVPITAITNGVHIPSWVSGEISYLYNRYLGSGWLEDPDSDAIWQKIPHIPDAEIWRMRERRRSRMISFVRNHLVEQYKRMGAGIETLRQASEVLDPQALTIVFARRFATYKRAIMIMEDLDRLERLLCNPERPVQIVFAGKAHPQDNEGKEFIRRIVEVCRQPRFRSHLVFLENYDINMARYLVQGADVWLNNPRRPLEACGTSGMKAAANGGLNLSILDGWWDEGYESGLGWAIGSTDVSENHELQDHIDAMSLYRLLEEEVIPLFYTKHTDGMPRGWIASIKQSLSKLAPVFNTHRMLEDYTDMFYVPAANGFNSMAADNYALARKIGAWIGKVMENWNQVQVVEVNGPCAESFTWGEDLPISAKVRLANLDPDDVRCEIYYGPLSANGEFITREVAPMQVVTQESSGVHLYSGKLPCTSNGRIGMKVRVTPFLGVGISQHAMGLVAWSN